MKKYNKNLKLTTLCGVLLKKGKNNKKIIFLICVQALRLNM